MPEEEANTFADDESTPNQMYRQSAFPKSSTSKNEDSERLRKVISTSFENSKISKKFSIRTH